MDFLIWFTFTADMNFSVSVTLYYFNFSAFSLSDNMLYEIKGEHQDWLNTAQNIFELFPCKCIGYFNFSLNTIYK